MPGLLQTERHAREIFAERRPLLDEETIEKRVQDRMDRQQVFERWPSPTFSFVLDHKKRQQIAYHEAYGRPHLITDPDQVRIMAERCGIIRAQALTPDESLALIEKMLGETR